MNRTSAVHDTDEACTSRDRFDRSPPPVSCSSPKLFHMMESAAELMMVHRDFQAAFDACNAGLEVLERMGPEDRSEEIKTGFCILGIQALAELNQWRGVSSWVLQHYGEQENVPAKIMQICILLYSKVKQPAVMQQATRDWLRNPRNVQTAGFQLVAELYLLHILLPLGHFEEARELVSGDFGRNTFTEEQRQTALDVVEEKSRQNQEDPINPDETPDSGDGESQPDSNQRSILRKVFRTIFRKCLGTGSDSSLLQKLFLAALLLYMLLFKLDPAFSSSYMWIFKLLQLIKQTWRATFSSCRPLV
ncbi:peroxisome assembly protein 26 [Poeciliopsis prolifica]|uniref:peroxisome assembly protein 26 n=1 Tax=Poeciliopsis prolifica TaxID=188132 RepID=UPI002413CF18|nr:peroxisome assembly protein 26 [Poeciliopsis prolifica]